MSAFSGISDVNNLRTFLESATDGSWGYAIDSGAIWDAYGELYYVTDPRAQ